MISPQNISSKTEILDGLKASFDDVAQSFSSVTDQEFFQQYNNKWSSGENLDHLIRSTKGIASALKMNKMVLRTTFGSAKKPSRSMVEVLQSYQEVLANGAAASGTFLPSAADRSDKKELLENWNTIAGKFESRLTKWSESDLDKYRLPHPVLGKLTIREMLFFTILHNYHHLKAIEVVKAGLKG